jgi:hypothetical protein
MLFWGVRYFGGTLLWESTVVVKCKVNIAFALTSNQNKRNTCNQIYPINNEIIMISFRYQFNYYFRCSTLIFVPCTTKSEFKYSRFPVCYIFIITYKIIFIDLNNTNPENINGLQATIYVVKFIKVHGKDGAPLLSKFTSLPTTCSKNCS